jgi:hypothetical protein
MYINLMSHYEHVLCAAKQPLGVADTGEGLTRRRQCRASPFEVEVAIAKLKRYKSPGSDQIPAELIQAGGDILHSKIHKLITSI